jgi:CRP-like cAMP-binding protein
MQPRDSLRRNPLFSVLDPHWVDGWLGSASMVRFDTDETLFQAGTTGDAVFLVLQGRVRVLRKTSEGAEVSIGRYRPGELLGEYALLPPGLNTATCRAAEAAILLRLPLAPLREVVMADAEIADNLKRWLRLHGLLGLRRGGLLLGFMSPSTLTPLLGRFQTASFQACEVIQAEGLNNDRWFVIQSGEVCVHPAADEPGGEPISLRAGDSFGARALLRGRQLPRAVANADTECQFLRRELFYQPLHGAPGPGLPTDRVQPPPQELQSDEKRQHP